MSIGAAPVSDAAGWLFLVVGPSGAGKDTLIAAARDALDGDGRYWFPRRVITRPAESGGEVHIAASRDAFDALRRGGGFALAWESHGLAYGVPAAIETRIARGTHVVVNVSRTVVPDCRRRFARVRVIRVTADPETLAARLRARGRETAVDVAARLLRAHRIEADLGETVDIDNSGALADAVARFTAALRLDAR